MLETITERPFATFHHSVTLCLLGLCFCLFRSCEEHKLIQETWNTLSKHVSSNPTPSRSPLKTPGQRKRNPCFDVIWLFSAFRWGVALPFRWQGFIVALLGLEPLAEVVQGLLRDASVATAMQHRRIKLSCYSGKYLYLYVWAEERWEKQESRAETSQIIGYNVW